MRVPLDQQEEEDLKELDKRRAFANNEIATELGENLEEVFEENGKMYKKQTVHKHYNISKTMEQEYSNLFLRHRLDFVRSVFDGDFDSAQTMRKFKHIYMKEMEENKHLYLKKGENQPKLSETETVLQEVL